MDMAKDRLLDGHGVLVLHLGKLGIIRSGEAGDIKVCVAAGNMNGELIIRCENDDVIGHAADDITEETGVQNNVAGGLDLRRDGGADAGLHIVAGDGEIFTHVEQQALQRGDGAFGGNGPGCYVDGALEQNLFAAELDHRWLPRFQEIRFLKNEKE